jgi:MATE family multidrug resistance protein
MKPVRQFRLDAAHIGALAAPLILTQLAQVALTTTDIVMMGMLGAREIAAGGLALTLFNQLRTMGTGLVTGTGNLVAFANGQNDPAQIRRLVRASFALTTLAAVVFALLMLVIEKPLVWLGQDPSVARPPASYPAAPAPGMLPCLWFQALRQYTVGLRNPGPLLAITIVSIALNAALDYALMFGRFGLPRLGLTGIAYATSGVYLLSFLMFLGVVARRRELSEHLTLIIGSLGASALAAQTIVNQVIYIVFMISVGLSHASSISISHACAQHDYRGAHRLGYTGLALGIGAMVLIALPYLAIPGAVIRPFLDAHSETNAEVLKLAAGLLTIAALLPSRVSKVRSSSDAVAARPIARPTQMPWMP